MPRAWTLALASLVTAMGCVPPEGIELEAEASSAELSVRAIEVSNGWQLELASSGDGMTEVGPPQREWPRVPTVRREALQADGTWVERRSPNERYARELNRRTTLSRGSTLLLGNGDYTFTDLHEDPGTYRLVVRTRAEGESRDVTLEYTVVGWSEEMLDASLELRGRADEASCWRVRIGVDNALIGRLEPDALIDLHERAPDRRARVRRAMLERGGFVVYLSEYLMAASHEEVRAVTDWLLERSDRVQRPLRHVVAARLTDPIFARGVGVDAADYRRLTQLDDYWPAGVSERLVERLEGGPEEGEALVALLDLFAHASGAFDDLRGRVWAALPGRCQGARDEAVVASCERARQIYDPESTSFMGWGAGCSGSSHCGFGWGRQSGVCAALEEEWNALRDEAGELEVVWLSGGVLEVTEP